MNVQLTPQFARLLLNYIATKPLNEVYNLFQTLSAAIQTAENPQPQNPGPSLEPVRSHPEAS